MGWFFHGLLVGFFLQGAIVDLGERGEFFADHVGNPGADLGCAVCGCGLRCLWLDGDILFGSLFVRAEFGAETAVAADQPVLRVLLDPVLQLFFVFVAFAGAFAGFDFLLGLPAGDIAGFPGGLFLFLPDLLFDLVDLFFFLFFEVLVVPEIGFIKRTLARIARIEDDLVNPRF